MINKVKYLVTKLLEKQAEYVVVLDVNINDVESVLYEVVAKNKRTRRTGRQDHFYKVILAEGNRYI
jgi:hypothetical protein